MEVSGEHAIDQYSSLALVLRCVALQIELVLNETPRFEILTRDPRLLTSSYQTAQNDIVHPSLSE